MYQFIHLETFAETVSAKAISRRNKINSKGLRNGGTKSLLNLRQVIAEAMREVGSCPHIKFPKPPTKIFGLDLYEVERLAILSKKDQVDAMGRNIRKDTPILLGGVASYPSHEHKKSQDKFNFWLNDNVEWLKKEFGDNLKNITLHHDEEHPHIHFFAVSPVGRAKHLHAGYMAESEVDVKDAKTRALAYKNGLRQFQDNYYNDVSAIHGMLRDGPKKQRKSRAMYQADKAHAQLLSSKINEIKVMDINAAAGIEQTYHEMIDKAEKVSEINASKVLAEAMVSASVKSNSMIKDAKLKIEKMFGSAQRELVRKRQEIILWSKNSVENMRKLVDAETKVQSLTTEVNDIREQLDYFMAENLKLKLSMTDVTKKM